MSRSDTRGFRNIGGPEWEPSDDDYNPTPEDFEGMASPAPIAMRGRSSPNTLRAIASDLKAMATDCSPDATEARTALLTRALVVIADQLEALAASAQEADYVVSLHRPLR